MSGPNIAKHYTRLLALWPKDPLRPTLHFDKVLQHRAAQASAGKSDLKAELGQINAAYSLLENRYMHRNPTSKRLLSPTSNPTYYDDLIAELEQAPKRSWLARRIEGWKRMIRFT
ncbi:uncharacterized protein BDZ99DRAFT_459848 [Mytilinidion resinicola]|uniref:Ubiquinol-cytochrome-c reductase complex assembly factor 2 n=1 Tax=Mytilinidion resinicola TaxID=574789 RepID=A0A6A6Z031_9PEZI|nr:uncharacterized protein BDZ99DRAFT_459848 [Mytilinidion resinicola]KAF2814138.1 hypothetical protein BDZ99DRAFT_459848 [Mytilinidion resinicola]